LMITAFREAGISGHALFPFKKIVDEDNYSLKESGRFEHNTHRQPYEPSEGVEMIDGKFHPRLQDLRPCQCRLVMAVYLWVFVMIRLYHQK
jgi:hypothetical protein